MPSAVAEGKLEEGGGRVDTFVKPLGGAPASGRVEP